MVSHRRTEWKRFLPPPHRRIINDRLHPLRITSHTTLALRMALCGATGLTSHHIKMLHPHNPEPGNRSHNTTPKTLLSLHVTSLALWRANFSLASCSYSIMFFLSLFSQLVRKLSPGLGHQHESHRLLTHGYGLYWGFLGLPVTDSRSSDVMATPILTRNEDIRSRSCYRFCFFSRLVSPDIHYDIPYR